MTITGMYYCFTQGDRRAFKATPVESIYASLFEVSGFHFNRSVLLYISLVTNCQGSNITLLCLCFAHSCIAHILHLLPSESEYIKPHPKQR